MSVKRPPSFDWREVERKEMSGPDGDSGSETELISVSRRNSVAAKVMYNEEIFFEPRIPLEEGAIDKVKWDINLRLDIGIPVIPTKSFKRETKSTEPSAKKSKTIANDIESDEEIGKIVIFKLF